MAPGFKDHFSGHAGLYARHRPRYPSELFGWLADAAGGRELAWDCGTGSGQAALALAESFRRVIATDASRASAVKAAVCAASGSKRCRSSISRYRSICDMGADFHALRRDSQDRLVKIAVFWEPVPAVGWRVERR